ncbi:MAG: hypothetical protein QM537_03765 [Candidatus Symbiobacter sp.]|nr:hypothetical protein [Candidatus Symbiobacter sp.]
MIFVKDLFIYTYCYAITVSTHHLLRIKRITIVEDQLGARLKSERRRLGHTQASFSELCGIATITQSLYEGDKRKPDAKYLQAAHKIGADVTYILFAVRQVPTLTPRETALLDNYKNSMEEGQRFIEQTALREAERKTEIYPQKIIRRNNKSTG